MLFTTFPCLLYEHKHGVYCVGPDLRSLYLVAVETQGVERGEGGNPTPTNTVYLVTRKEEPERKERGESVLASL